MKIIYALVGIFLLPSLVFASPTQSSVTKLAELVPYEAVFFDLVISPIEQERQALAYTLTSDTTLTDTQRKNAIKAFDDYAQNLIKVINTPAIKQELKNNYINSAIANYTQAEVDAQIAFYGSEAGKSALQKNEKVLGDYMQNMTPKGLKVLEEYQKKNLMPMQDSIKRILNK